MSRTGLPQECAGELVILIRLVQRALGLQVPDKVRGEGRHQSLAPLTDVANVTVRQAAVRLGVSECRVRKLARDGRVLGAMKAGAEWLIPTPIEMTPGRRGPAGVASHIGEAEVSS